jgi:hypothetical protein
MTCQSRRTSIPRSNLLLKEGREACMWAGGAFRFGAQHQAFLGNPLGWLVAGGSTGSHPGRSHQGAKGLDLEGDMGYGLAGSQNRFRLNRNISRKRN